MINVSQETTASTRYFTSVKIKLSVNSQSHNLAQCMGSFLQGIILKMSFKGSCIFLWLLIRSSVHRQRLLTCKNIKLSRQFHHKVTATSIMSQQPRMKCSRSFHDRIQALFPTPNIISKDTN